MNVTIVEKSVCFATVDEERRFVQAELVDKGVKVITSQSATCFEENGKVDCRRKWTKLASDVTILCRSPALKIALATSSRHIAVLGHLADEHYETKPERYFAVGDAILVKL